MARRYRRRFRRRSGRWAPNIQKVLDVVNVNGEGEFSGNLTLTSNPIQSNATVSQTYTVKNFEITFTLESQNTNGPEAVTVYIMYVPQGMTVGNDYYLQHPEYIMAYKYIGSPSGFSGGYETQQFQPIRVKSRMARKLQTGDQIIFFIQGTSQATTAVNIEVSGLVRWWTKAN